MDTDQRIAVVVGEAAEAASGDHVLHAAAQGLPGHPGGCACCRPRSALGLALAQLFLARARDPAQDFARVLVVGLDAGAVASAIADDVLARARYRFAGPA